MLEEVTVKICKCFIMEDQHKRRVNRVKGVKGELKGSGTFV